MARCNRCSREWQNICNGMSQNTNFDGSYPLRDYLVYKRGNKLIVTDGVIEGWEYSE